MIATSDDFVQFQIIHLVSWEQQHEFWAEIHLRNDDSKVSMRSSYLKSLSRLRQELTNRPLVEAEDAEEDGEEAWPSDFQIHASLPLLCHKSVIRYMLLISLDPRQWTEISRKLHQWTSVPHGWRCRRNALRPKPEMEMFHHRAAWHIWVDSYRSKAPCNTLYLYYMLYIIY